MKQLAKRIAKLYKELKNITSELHLTVVSTGFIKKALHHEVTPKLAQVKGNFMNVKSENCIHLSHLNNHVRCNKLLIKKHCLLNKLIQKCGALLITAVLRYISTL